MRVYLKIISLVLLIFLNLFSNAQEKNSTQQIKWTQPKAIKISQYDTQKLLSFEDAQYIGDIKELPYIQKVVPIESNLEVGRVEINNSIFTSLSASELNLLPSNLILLDSPELIYATVYDKKKPFLEYRILPFRQTAKGIEKLVSFELNVSLSPNTPSSAKPKSLAANSILSSGTWFKIGVTSTGIYKISKQTLINMGMNTSFNPMNFRVYGNGGAMLPERNNIFYPDDLAENAIYFQGEQDGNFDDQDFVLFYAKGPASWSYDNAKGIFKHSKNLYSDTAWYFINSDLGPGKRISSQAQSSATATHTVDVFDDYGFVENDQENFMKTGRRWFGNRMEATNSFSFNFNFPNATAGPHKLTSNLLARNTSITNFNVSVNGQSFSQTVNALSGVGYLDTYAKENESTFIVNGNLSNANITIDRQTSGSIGWIDYLILNVKRNLAFTGSQVQFRSQEVTGIGNIGIG